MLKTICPKRLGPNFNSGVPINDEVDLGIQVIGVLNDAWQACGVAMEKSLQKGINVNW